MVTLEKVIFKMFREARGVALNFLIKVSRNKPKIANVFSSFVNKQMYYARKNANKVCFVNQ